mgnify:CR=1 FL=1
MENQQVTHISPNTRYRIVFERSAVKGIDGFKVEANGDDYATTMIDAEKLYEEATRFTTPITKEVVNG